MTAPDRVLVTVLTHRGAVRDHNEDAVAVGPLSTAGNDTAAPVTVVHAVGLPLVVAVADGLGGHAGGEVAAGHAARRLAALGHSDGSPAAVAALLSTVDAEITGMGAADRDLAGMGTTVAGLLLAADRTVWFNVGDSRVFKLEGGYLGQSSVDDSPGGARTDGEGPVTSIVTQTLGGGPPVHPHVGVDPDGRTGRWLVCSDGLTDLVRLGDLEAILLAADGDDPLAARRLWEAAMAAGGTDNISLALVRRTAAPRTDPAAPAPAGGDR
jgi:serine/threonine protein phosphatase PrpC